MQILIVGSDFQEYIYIYISFDFMFKLFKRVVKLNYTLYNM